MPKHNVHNKHTKLDLPYIYKHPYINSKKKENRVN